MYRWRDTRSMAGAAFILRKRAKRFQSSRTILVCPLAAATPPAGTSSDKNVIAFGTTKGARTPWRLLCTATVGGRRMPAPDTLE